MRRTLTLGVAWIAAAVTATAIAWQGVRLAGDQVTDDRPASLTAAEVEAAVAEGASTTGSTVAPSSSTTTPADGTSPSTTATAPAGPAPETRTYALTGGTVALHFAPSGVTVAFATPAPGYQVRSEPTEGGGWRVEFDGPAGRSRVEGWWDGGPQARVDDDGSGASEGDDDSRGSDD